MLHDVDAALLGNGTPANTWSVINPTLDLEYADDTLLMGVTKPQLQQMFSALEEVASEYGMRLNHQKTELLVHPQADHTAIKFKDGSKVPFANTVKYLGNMITWHKPSDCAFYHRV